MKYIINKHGVVLNPEVEVIIDNNQYYMAIEYASDNNGRWAEGYTFRQLYGTFHGRGSSPGFGERITSYDTMEEARQAGIKRAYEFAERHEDAIKYVRAFETPQLTLF